MRTRVRAAGFTLLEAVIAVAILTVVMVVCLDIRARSLAAAEQVSAVQRRDRVEGAVLDSLVNGLLAYPEFDRETNTTTWRGELDDVPYAVVKLEVMIDNPMAGQVDAAVVAQVMVHQYTLDVGGRIREFYWNR